MALVSPVVQAQPVATAHHAALVIQHGDGSLTWAVVAFPGATVSGIDLLKRSGIAVVTVPFGALGDAVCQIEREGCPVPECQRTVCETSARSSFWRYYERGPDGSWHSTALGASATKAHDGDVFAWSWGNGDLNLNPMTLPEIARHAGLDPANLTSAPAQETNMAVVRSEYVGRDSRSGHGQVWVGVGGLAAILVTGAVLLGVQRRPLRWS